MAVTCQQVGPRPSQSLFPALWGKRSPLIARHGAFLVPSADQESLVLVDTRLGVSGHPPISLTHVPKPPASGKSYDVLKYSRVPYRQLASLSPPRLGLHEHKPPRSLSIRPEGRSWVPGYGITGLPFLSRVPGQVRRTNPHHHRSVEPPIGDRIAPIPPDSVPSISF